MVNEWSVAHGGGGDGALPTDDAMTEPMTRAMTARRHDDGTNDGVPSVQWAVAHVETAPETKASFWDAKRVQRGSLSATLGT